jgi:signal transduction histidine kinase
MATLIRESITESRRVVGMLRENPPVPSMQDELSANLHSIASTFNERTGVSCRFDESGTPHYVSLQQRESFQLALREMLTNAHRHGAAQMMWITLEWQNACLYKTMDRVRTQPIPNRLKTSWATGLEDILG